MAIVISLAMQKGGVGKTTTTINLGACLVKMSYKVLLIDIDPQANLTRGVGVTLGPGDYSIYDVLLNPEKGIEYAIHKTACGADLLPSILALAGAEIEVSNQIGRELLLRDALRRERDKYDYILIDAPPSLGIFFLNAIAASDDVVVPVEMQIFPFDAFPQLEASIKLIRKLNPTLKIGGIICTKYDARTNLNKTVLDQIKRQYGDLVFETVIPYNITLAEAPVAGSPIIMYDPKSAGAKAYSALADELDKRYGNQR